VTDALEIAGEPSFDFATPAGARGLVPLGVRV
jgi:hypothetical protein